MYEDIFKSIRQAAEKRRIPHYITADRTDGMFFPLFCEGRLIIPSSVKTHGHSTRTVDAKGHNWNDGEVIQVAPRQHLLHHWIMGMPIRTRQKGKERIEGKIKQMPGRG